jgi:hypothetical protein
MLPTVVLQLVVPLALLLWLTLRRHPIQAAWVLAGALLGRVGNAGNTSEPRLHIHAQRPSTDAMPVGGAPLPVRIGGRHLARDDRIRSVQ